MTQQDAFGGAWTQDKLIRLRDYLRAYVKIFKNRPYFETVYVDAFAGTGAIPAKPASAGPGSEPEEGDVQGFLAGSARVALEIEPSFKRYLFVEKSPKKAEELAALRSEYPALSKRVEVVRAEANQYLLEWVGRTDWKRTRAVVFLDPCGMQVNWELLAALGATGGVDLWLLVPIGMGVNRLLTQTDLPPAEWQERLTRFLGTDDWRSGCYRPVRQRDLFGEGPILEKAINYDGLSDYFNQRLKTIFPFVAPKPLVQRNSRKSPMFTLTFAASNATALKIADYLLRRTPGG